MLYSPFLPSCFFICVIRPSVSHFPYLSVSLFCIYRMPVTVKALMWEFIYVLPTLFAFPYCFTDVGSSGKEPAELDHLTPVFTDKHHSHFLCIKVHFSEANVRNKSPDHHVTKLYMWCLYHRVKKQCAKCIPACFCIFYKGILYDCCAHLFNMLLTRRGLVHNVMISKSTCKTLLLPLCALKAGMESQLVALHRAVYSG